MIKTIFTFSIITFMASVILGHGNFLEMIVRVKMSVIYGFGFPFSSEAVFSIMAYFAFSIFFSLIKHG